MSAKILLLFLNLIDSRDVLHLVSMYCANKPLYLHSIVQIKARIKDIKQILTYTLQFLGCVLKFSSKTGKNGINFGLKHGLKMWPKLGPNFPRACVSSIYCKLRLIMSSTYGTKFKLLYVMTHVTRNINPLQVEILLIDTVCHKSKGASSLWNRRLAREGIEASKMSRDKSRLMSSFPISNKP